MPERTTVKIRTVSGEDHILSTFPYHSFSTHEFTVRIRNHKKHYEDQCMHLGLIDGGTIYLNPSAIESYRDVPVPRHTSVHIRKGTFSHGDYVDGYPNF